MREVAQGVGSVRAAAGAAWILGQESAEDARERYECVKPASECGWMLCQCLLEAIGQSMRVLSWS